MVDVTDTGDLAARLRLLERNRGLQRRADVIDDLRAIVELAPERHGDRLLLGRALEQRGQEGEAGRQFDWCVDRLSREGSIDVATTTALLRNAHFGSSSRETVARLEQLAALLDGFAEDGPAASRAIALSRGRVLLALGDRDGFLAAIDDAQERWPDHRGAVELAAVGARWRSAEFPDSQAEKIFVIGLSRTGTSSMHRALRHYGYRSLHWVNHLTGALPDALDHHLFDAFSDINISAVFESLYFQFPSARFIWTERPAASWSRSVEAHYRNFAGVTHPSELLSPAHALRFGARNGEIHASVYANHDSWSAAHAAYQTRVEAFFADKPAEKLLRISVTSGEEWDPISEFLDRPTPDAPFPHANAAPSETAVEGA